MNLDHQRIPLVDLHAQYLSIRPEIDLAIAGVIAESSFILGREVEAFESEFASWCGTRSCVGCGNGTDAIALALQGVGVKPGDEVITVSHTFIASAEAITAVGAKPVFVDVRDDTLLMDVSRVEAAITPKTSAVLPVHLYGQTVDMDPLLAIARRHNLKVVEDAAQAHGARYKGRRAGTMGEAGTFSFYPGKNLGAYGDAGAVVTDNPDVANWIRKARNHGRATKYEHDFEARCTRMDGIQGAILRVKLRRLEAWNARRRELAAEYNRLFSTNAAVRPVAIAEGCEPVFHLYVVRVPRRDAVLEGLKREGIEGGIHYPVPLHLQRAYEYLRVPRGTLPRTEQAAREILSLPLYAELDVAAIRRIASLLAVSSEQETHEAL